MSKKPTESDADALKAKYALPEGKFDSLSFEDHQALLQLMKQGKIKVEAPDGKRVQFDQKNEGE